MKSDPMRPSGRILCPTQSHHQAGAVVNWSGVVHTGPNPLFSPAMMLRERPTAGPLTRWQASCAAILFATLSVGPPPVRAANGELELSVHDAQTREPTAVRIDLRNARGHPVRVSPVLPRVGPQFAFDGQVVLELRPGRYTFRLEKGPEYRVRTGHFVIESGAADHHEVDMQQFVDMAGEGWWSGDLQLQLFPRQTPLLMLAEDLHLAPVVTLSNTGSVGPAGRKTQASPEAVGQHRWLEPGAVRLVSPGSEVLLFGATGQPDPLPSATESFATWEWVRSLRKNQGVHLHLGSVVDWDLPLWVASQQLGSVGVLHAGVGRQDSTDPVTGNPRDPTLFPDPLGTGRWAQEVYFRLLESGHSIPPGAGSGAGVTDNPPGHNRVYVHCGPEFSPRSWWDGLRAGRVVITNGPLLRPLVNGQLPGHVFSAQAGEELELTVELKLATQEKVRYLEIIKNGRSVQQVRLEDWAAQGGQLPAVRFHESGWLLVRAVTENSETYRAASTGPFYVEFNGQARVSRRAAEFFLDWVVQRARQVKRADPEGWAAMMPVLRTTRDYWQQRVSEATTD